MKIILLLLFILFFFSCGPWPGYGDNTVNSISPNVGCKQDVTVQYANKSDNQLYVYYIEIRPGDSYKCESLLYKGILDNGETFSFFIHKGKTMNIIFATSQSGKCSTAARKLDSWIDCSKTTSDETYFEVPK